MELILKQDVEHLGFKDDVVTVKNGFGRNYLIPRGMATMATSSAKKVLEENLRQRAHKEIAFSCHLIYLMKLYNIRGSYVCSDTDRPTILDGQIKTVCGACGRSTEKSTLRERTT